MNIPNLQDALAAYNSDVAVNDEEAQVLYNGLKSKDEEVQAKSLKALAGKSHDFRNALYGKPISDASKAARSDYAPDMAYKHDQLRQPRATTAYTFDQLSTALNLDLLWMQFYQMIDSRNGDEVDLQTITNLVTFKEYLDTEDIEMSPLAALSAEKLRSKRFAVGVSFLNRWMKTNGTLTLQQIMQRIMVAEQKKKASVAYTALADTSGVTVESFATNIVTTVNNGVNGMINALLALNSAYDITDGSQMLLLSSSVNKPAIEAQFNTIRGQDGRNPILEYNVKTVYTRNTNVLADLGLGGANRAMLVLPGIANVWADFEMLKVESKNDPSKDAVAIFAQGYYNQQVKAAQKRVITLA